MKSVIRQSLCVALLTVLGSTPAWGEQVASFDDMDVHHVVFNSLFLQPDIAARYDITRAGNRAVINLSVLDKDGQPMAANIRAWTTNLLGQRNDLRLREVREGDAIYYIGQFRHTDEDRLRFHVEVEADGRQRSFDFEQQMYVERS